MIAALPSAPPADTHRYDRLREVRDVVARLREMKLYGMASQWPELSVKARQHQLPPEQWFGELLQAETTERQVRALANQMKVARFPRPSRSAWLRLRLQQRRSIAHRAAA